MNRELSHNNPGANGVELPMIVRSGNRHRGKLPSTRVVSEPQYDTRQVGSTIFSKVSAFSKLDLQDF